MESILIWAVAIVVVAAIFIPYFIKYRRQQNAALELKKEAVRLGADKPIAQYPQIDELRCIGCGACVDACPEGDVLGIVFGKATVINGLKCVGHGRCAEACPVMGIKVGLGDIKKRDDIPVMNEFNETNIPGIYIAGELGGLALIRNAVSQGKMVIETIAEKAKRSTHDDIKDVVIVGAGPAGMSAALTALQNKLSYVVLDQQGFGGTILHYPRKKLVLTRPIEIPLYGWLNKPEYSKEELLDIWHQANAKHHLNVKIGQKLVDVKRDNGHFIVKSQDQELASRYVVLALGRRGTPRKLGVPGEDLPKVMYKLLDAESYRDNHILIVGGGDSAVEAAIGLARQPGNTITLSYRKARFFRIKKKNEERISEVIGAGAVNVIYNSTVKEILEKSVILRTEEGEKEIANDYVFIFAGGEPPFKLLRQIGIAFGGESKA